MPLKVSSGRRRGLDEIGYGTRGESRVSDEDGSEEERPGEVTKDFERSHMGQDNQPSFSADVVGLSACTHRRQSSCKEDPTKELGPWSPRAT